MATHSSIFAWRIPWTEEPDRLQSGGRKELDMAEHTHMQARFYPSVRGLAFACS